MDVHMEIKCRETIQRLISQKNVDLENEDATYLNYLKVLARHQFQLKAIIQDILECRDSMESLSRLNEKGRSKITEIRDEIENLDLYARQKCNKNYMLEVESQKHQLASMLREFKNANIHSMFTIEKLQRADLLKSANKDDSSIRQRQKKVNRDGLLKMSSGVTEQLLSISRQLADTTERSQLTLDNLVSSSSTVHGTQSELENTAGSINQSSKLLKKYGRREFTDKIIMFFAFLFFVAVCLYIVRKRVF